MIVLISGYAGSGKDTFAKFLQEYLQDCEILHFADPIKECAAKYFCWDGNKDEKGRRLLQQLGRVGREYQKDIWVLKLIERMVENKKFYIVPDWRFKNEFKLLVEKYGRWNIVAVRVIRDGIKILDDISEHDLDDFKSYDYIVFNDSTLDDLKKAARVLANRLRVKKHMTFF